MKEKAIKLWELLDDIDTASDLFKPNDLKSYEVYYKYITKKYQERFKIFTSDGYNLFDPKTKEKVTEQNTETMAFNSD